MPVLRRSAPPWAVTPPPPSRARAALAAAGALNAGTLVPLALTAGTAHASAPDGGDVIANLWEWNWPSVAGECTSVLGPKGCGAVQVAPPQDSIRLDQAGHPWWEVHQPAGYDLNSRTGTRQQWPWSRPAATPVSGCSWTP